MVVALGTDLSLEIPGRAPDAVSDLEVAVVGVAVDEPEVRQVTLRERFLDKVLLQLDFVHFHCTTVSIRYYK